MTQVKTKDNYEVKKGDWISDDSGIYEIKDIRSFDGMTTLEEVSIDDDGEYCYTGYYRYLTASEIGKMHFE